MYTLINLLFIIISSKTTFGFIFDIDINELEASQVMSDISPDQILTPFFNQPLPPQFRRNAFYFLLVLIFVLAYGYIGYRRNYKIVKQWANAILPILEGNFVFIQKEPDPIYIRGWHSFEMYASGRTSCNGMLLRLELVKRECIWHEHIIKFIYPDKDQISIEVSFKFLDTITFGLCRETKNKAFIDVNYELLRYSTLYHSKEIPQGYRAYINSTDKSVTSYVSFVLTGLKKYIDYLESFYISDITTMQGMNKLSPRMYIKFDLTHDEDLYKELIQHAIYLIDYSKNYAIPPKVRDAIIRERLEIYKIYQRIDKDDEEDKVVSPDRLKKLESKLAKKHKLIPPGVKFTTVK